MHDVFTKKIFQYMDTICNLLAIMGPIKYYKPNLSLFVTFFLMISSLSN